MARAVEERAIGNLRLICINDVYRPEMYSVFKALLPRYQHPTGMTKVILPGDFLGGSFFGAKSTGEGVLKIMNEVGFDYVTIGNHGLAAILSICIYLTHFLCFASLSRSISLLRIVYLSLCLLVSLSLSLFLPLSLSPSPRIYFEFFQSLILVKIVWLS
jgi:hypothetical protein